MSKCWACGQPVYFAERRTSLGKDWHPQCLRCVHCKKILQPGQHAEHNRLPYCEKPCYNVLFGPKIHGFRVNDHILHNKFGNPNEWKSPVATLQRSELIQKIRTYNQRQLACNRLEYSELNGRILISGFVRVQWRVCEKLHLREEVDAPQRNGYMYLPNSNTASAFVPSGSITSVHATNEETSETVIENLLRKFSIRNDPQDFVLVIAFPKRVVALQHSASELGFSNPLQSAKPNESSKRAAAKHSDPNGRREAENKQNGTNSSTSLPLTSMVESVDGETAFRIVENESPLIAVFELLLDCVDDRQREEVTVYITDYFALADLLLVPYSNGVTQPNSSIPTSPASSANKPKWAVDTSSKSLKTVRSNSTDSRSTNGLVNHGFESLSLNILERILRCVNEQEQREFMRIRNKYKQCRMHLEFAMNKDEILL